MTKFMLRRLANYLVLVFIATSLAYILAAVSLHPKSNYEGRNPRPSESVISEKLDSINSNPNTPVLERYGTWLDDVVHGNLGLEVQGGSVNDDVERRMWVSGQLLLIGTIIGGLVGVTIGAWSAVRQYKFVDHFFTVSSFILLSIPTFVLAILLQLLAVKANKWIGHRVFQYSGQFDPAQNGGTLEHIINRLDHLILPTIVLVVTGAAFLSRYQRNAMLDVLGSDYVRTARAKGLRRRTALTKHALRTALIPAVTIFVYSFALIFVGATFTEIIFGWHGMGELLVTSIQSNDTNATAAVTLFVAVLVLLASLMQDFVVALLDPRVRS
ncbi:MAG TPA: ABC transporter permease [Jatrophihabitantaceae bacterium]|nr:ABC transporter permease [Jatrophihabitantaceae bacterium]